MNGTFNVSSFFEPLHNPSVSPEMYLKAEEYISVIDRIASTCNMSVYVIDYKKKEFMYVSANSLFLSGYTAEEVKRHGYKFYSMVVNKDELHWLAEVNKTGFQFYYNLPIEKRYLYTIEYDFHLNHLNKSVTKINHKLIPISINEKGDLWLALCVVSLSIHKKQKQAFIKSIKTREIFIFNNTEKSWNKIELIPLTPKEKTILQLSSQGYTNQKIAEELTLNINTIKFHKSNIFQKLGTENCIESLTVAAHWGLL